MSGANGGVDIVRIRNALLADADELARIMIDANQDAFRGLVPQQCLNCITPQESADNWRRTVNRGGDMNADDRLLVAETEHPSHVIGFVLVRITAADEGSRRGGLRVISVSPAFQRRGVGRRLVHAAAAHLVSIGVSSMIVRVLSVNPNRSFYTHLGGRFLREEPHDWNGIPLAMSVYEWSDLSPLLAPRASDDQAWR